MKKIIASTLIVTFTVYSLLAPFQTVEAATQVSIPQTVNPQAASYNTTTSGGAFTAPGGAVTSGLGACVGSILGQAIARAVTTGLASLLGSKIGGKILKSDVTVQQPTQDAKNLGWVIFGIPTGISWDSIGYCFVNAMIQYLTTSTIAWINSGFKGNPVFLTNSQNFFKSLADQEAGGFIQQIVGQTTGINVCQPFRIQVGIGLAQQYGSSFAQRSQCSLTQAEQNINGFVNGNWSQGGMNSWINLTQNQQNNPYGIQLMSNNELYSRIAVKNNVATFDLGLNKGWLNFQVCSNPSGKTDVEKDCHTTTPGGVIADEFSKTTGMSKTRLTMANSFDQVVTALVNELIKIALSEVTTGTMPGGGASTQSTYNINIPDSQNNNNNNNSNSSNNGNTGSTVVATPVQVTSISGPVAGASIGTTLTIGGTGFDANSNFVLLNGKLASPQTPSNGTSLTFTVPSITTTACNLFGITGTCVSDIQTITNDSYQLSVTTAKGTSAGVNLVISSSTIATTTATTTYNLSNTYSSSGYTYTYATSTQ